MRRALPPLVALLAAGWADDTMSGASAADGSVSSSSWPAADDLDPDEANTPISVMMDGTLMSGVRIGLEGLDAGSRVLVGIAPTEGVAVAPVAGQPAVELHGDRVPSITVPATAPPDELVAQLLVEGSPADGYPEGNGTIPAGATLVFVVDFLDTSG